MAKPNKRARVCSVCGFNRAEGCCADCFEDICVEVPVCGSDKCKAEHVMVFHDGISCDDFAKNRIR